MRATRCAGIAAASRAKSAGPKEDPSPPGERQRSRRLLQDLEGSEAEEKPGRPRLEEGARARRGPLAKRGALAQALCPPHGGQEGEQGALEGRLEEEVRSRGQGPGEFKDQEERRQEGRRQAQIEIEEAKLQGRGGKEAGPREARETDQQRPTSSKTGPDSSWAGGMRPGLLAPDFG